MNNVFESGSRKCIPAVLIYAYRNPKALLGEREFLMMERVRPGDFHQGRYNGLGGKCEVDESYLQAAVREFYEESGFKVTADDFRFSGLIHFPNFKPHRFEDWMVCVFIVDVTSVAYGSNPELPDRSEGVLRWVPESRIFQLPLWPGDHRFLPWVLKGKKFIGTIWYQDGEVFKEEWVHSE